MLDAAATLEEQMQPLPAFGKLADHPWRGVQNIEITELDESRLMALLSDWTIAIRDVLERSSIAAKGINSGTPATLESLEELWHRVADLQLPSAALIAQTYTACSTALNRLCLRNAIRLFRELLDFESTLSTLTADPGLTRKVGSQSLDSAISALRERGIAQFSVGSAIALRKEQEQLADLVANIQPLCEALVSLIGLQDPDIASLRAAVAAVQLLQRLPRPLWTRRSALILDETNQAALSQA